MVDGFNPYDSGPVRHPRRLRPVRPPGGRPLAAHRQPVRPGVPADRQGASSRVAGHNVIVGTLLQRLVELVGVAMIVWALPRLARICGFDPVAALWLGALNPLVLFHLIGGGHNEALMLGRDAGRHGDRLGVVVGRRGRGDHPRRRDQGDGRDGAGLPGDHAGAAGRRSMARSAALRGPGGRGRGRHLRRRSPGLAGVGFGWLAALGAPGTVRSFLSLSTTLGVGAGQAGLLLGLGDHTQAALDVMQPVGTLIGAAVALVIMWQCWQRRINPVLGPRHGDDGVRAAGPGDPALVSALGGAAARRVDGGPALPQGDDLADGAVLGDDHAERRDHPGVRHRAGGGGGGDRGRRRVLLPAPSRAPGHPPPGHVDRPGSRSSQQRVADSKDTVDDAGTGDAPPILGRCDHPARRTPPDQARDDAMVVERPGPPIRAGTRGRRTVLLGPPRRVWSPCSARTAPARPARWMSVPGSPGPTPARSRCSAWIPGGRAPRCGRGSASCCRPVVRMPRPAPARCSR